MVHDTSSCRRPRVHQPLWAALLVRDTAPGQESALPYGTSAHASSTISYLPQGGSVCLVPGVLFKPLLMQVARISVRTQGMCWQRLRRRWSNGQ